MDGDLASALGRIALAALLGGLIGLDREWRGHAAGLRTNILVCASAAAFADVSIHGFAPTQGYDPSRVAADIVSGIGFLGAGAIFAMGGRPRGLTTAAALWASAAIGLTVGVGRWQVAVGLVVLSLLALVVVNALGDRFLTRRRTVRDLYLVVDDAPDVDGVQRHLDHHGVRIRQLSMHELKGHVGVDMVITGARAHLDTALRGLADIDGVRFASDERGEVIDE